MRHPLRRGLTGEPWVPPCDKEWDDYRVQLTDWEQERYLSVL